MLDLLSIKINKQVAQKYWPAKLTIECDSANAPIWLHPDTDYFGVRMPANNQLLKLIEDVGPLISTSANVEGAEPAITSASAQDDFGEQLDFYVDHGELKSKPSTLVRLMDNKIEVLRAGAVKIAKEDREKKL